MSAYNAHKRATLDRLTQKYQLRMREVMRRHASSVADDFLLALNDGDKTFKPATARLRAQAGQVFEDHAHDVVNVGVSDGIQEVSPEKDLSQVLVNGWALFPLNTPVEDTLSVSLANERDKFVKAFKSKYGLRLAKRLAELLDTHVTDYLGNLKKVYQKLASNWLDGESSIVEVKEAIKQALHVTDSEATRTFRTQTTQYFNESRQEYFADNTSVDYMQLFAVTDGRISAICEDRHKFVISIADAKSKKHMPPFHPNCRTIQRALMSFLPAHKKMIDEGLAMNESAFTKLPKGWA